LSSNEKRIVIVGATSAMAEHCARLWVQGQPVDLILVGRDAARVERVAADLRVRSPQSDIRVVQSDFLDANAIRSTVDTIAAQGAVDIVLIAHGSLPAQADCQDDLDLCRDALEVNGVSPVLFAEAFAKHMAQANCGTLALIGSVAGDRGRKSNYVYGAAKGMVTRYAQGLQHRFAGSNVKVVLIKPGPTDTPMTAHLKGQGPKMASVESVARKIDDAVERGQAEVYVPGKWAVIMMVIRHLPGVVFNRLDI
jgi:decaprenylphospho-beta-D-erythro-pentofuranosid-2-ulose 2-reductase